MRRASVLFLMGALVGAIASFAISSLTVSAQAVQSWSKNQVTPIIFVKPSFGAFVPSDGATIGLTWQKDEVLPVALVKPAIGGFAPVDGMAIGNTWPKENVKPVVFVTPYSGMFVVSGQSGDAAPTVAPPSARKTSSCDPPIETHIDGDFNGWDDELIYKMDDGSIWQQANYHYHYHYTYHPSVLIFSNSAGVCHMKVDGDDDEGADVRRLK
jgi:hypothetical protein